MCKNLQEGVEPESFEWRHCPSMEGEFETGCHTEAGNDIVLYMDTTARLHAVKIHIFEVVWKRCPLFKDIRKYLEDNHTTRIPDGFNIVNGGIWVPTTIADEMHRMTKGFLKLVKEQYAKELKIEAPEHKHLFDDFANWMMRDFERWLNDTHGCAKKHEGRQA